MSTPFNKTVLVMDDELSTVKGITRLAEAEGIQVLRFEHCDELQSWFETQAAWLAQETTQLCLVLNLKFVSEVFAQVSWEGLSRSPIICICRDAISLNQHQNLVTGLFRYLEKPFTLSTMETAINDALLEYSSRLTTQRAEKSLLEQYSQLTKREREVCELVVHGLPNKRISDMLGITLKTVKAHRAKVMAKTAAGSLPELIRKYDTLKRAHPSLLIPQFHLTDLTEG